MQSLNSVLKWNLTLVWKRKPTNMEISNVCDPCGISANVLTCLKKYKQRPNKLKFDTSTYNTAKCDFCGETKPVTEVRDFFFPDFKLLEKKIKVL